MPLSNVVYNCYLALKINYHIMEFISEALLVTILWDYAKVQVKAENNEPKIEEVLLATYDSDAEIQAKMWNSLVRNPLIETG